MKKPASPVLETAPPPYAAYIGIDWADQKHDLRLYDPIRQQFEFPVIDSKPEAINAWVKN